MNPNDFNQPQTVQPTTYSIDYLNQIAAPVEARKGPPKWAVLAGILAFVATLVVGILVFFAAQPNSNDKALAYYYRVSTLKTIATENQAYLRDTQLRSRNSSVVLLLTSAESNAKTELEKLGINPSAKSLASSSTKLSEDKFAEALTRELDNSRLNATLDQTYPREISYQLQSMLNQLSILKKMSKSQSLHNYIDETTTSIKPAIATLDAS